MREAKARRGAVAAPGAGVPLPPGAEPVARSFTGKQIKRTAQMRSEESKSREAAKKFEKKFAELADPAQPGVFLRFVSGVLGRLPREYATNGFQIKQIQ
eukprot:13482973-Alexandrium_andersonii.AAC.1